MKKEKFNVADLFRINNTETVGIVIHKLNDPDYITIQWNCEDYPHHYPNDRNKKTYAESVIETYIKIGSMKHYPIV